MRDCSHTITELESGGAKNELGLQIPKLLPFIRLKGHMFKSRGKDYKVDKVREKGKKEGRRREEERQKENFKINRRAVVILKCNTNRSKSMTFNVDLK